VKTKTQRCKSIVALRPLNIQSSYTHRVKTARKNRVKKTFKKCKFVPIHTTKVYGNRGGVEAQILFLTSALDGGVNNITPRSI
jgi:hypothetical protein